MTPAATKQRADCLTCAHLRMRCEHYPHLGFRRVFWWHCAKGYEHGQSVHVIDEPCADDCDAAGGFEQRAP